MHIRKALMRGRWLPSNRHFICGGRLGWTQSRTEKETSAPLTWKLSWRWVQQPCNRACCRLWHTFLADRLAVWSLKWCAVFWTNLSSTALGDLVITVTEWGIDFYYFRRKVVFSSPTLQGLKIARLFIPQPCWTAHLPDFQIGRIAVTPIFIQNAPKTMYTPDAKSCGCLMSLVLGDGKGINFQCHACTVGTKQLWAFQPFLTNDFWTYVKSA